MSNIKIQLDDLKYVLRYKSCLTHRWVFLDIANQREVSNPMEISMYLTAEQIERVIPIARESAKLKGKAEGIGAKTLDNIELSA